MKPRIKLWVIRSNINYNGRYIYRFKIVGRKPTVSLPASYNSTPEYGIYLGLLFKQEI